MIEHQESWQDLMPNGERDHRPRRPGDPLPHGNVCAASHLWLWRYDKNGDKEILLQKRAMSKKSWPGFYDVSVAGHINFEEKPIVAALREAKEELNLDLQLSAPILIGVYRLYARTWHDQQIIDELQWVYIHELEDDVSIAFNDGEVDVVAWMKLDDFEQRIQDEEFLIVKHDKEYFALMINAVKRQ